MKKVLSVYTHSMTTIYLSLSAQVAISTFFMKSPLYDKMFKILLNIFNFHMHFKCRLVEKANAFVQADGFYMTATWMFIR